MAVRTENKAQEQEPAMSDTKAESNLLETERHQVKRVTMLSNTYQHCEKSITSVVSSPSRREVVGGDMFEIKGSQG